MKTADNRETAPRSAATANRPIPDYLQRKASAGITDTSPRASAGRRWQEMADSSSKMQKLSAIQAQAAQGGELDMQRKPGLAAAATGGKVVQKRTHILYGTPQNFSYFDPANGPAGGGAFPANNAQSRVGENMTAELDLTDPVHGSGVGGLIPAPLMANLNANFPGLGWVQGHLLNSNLGGVGIPANLAPITQEANMLHTWAVEQKVKRLLYNQPPGGNFELVNNGYVEYEVDAQPAAGLGNWNSTAPNADFVCNWRRQLPQAMPPGPGGPVVWGPWQTFTVPSRTSQATPPVPGAWAPFGVGLGVPLGVPGGAVNAAIWNVAAVAGNPAFIAAIGGPAAWNPPAGAVQVITQHAPPGGANPLKIIGWQF